MRDIRNTFGQTTEGKKPRFKKGKLSDLLANAPKKKLTLSQFMNHEQEQK